MKQKNRIGGLLMMTGFVFSAIFSPSLLRVAHAAAPGQVVINELAWAGSQDSSTDEWIELYNNSGQAVDLSNWHIDPGHTTSNYKILSGTIQPHGYFLIEDHESAVSTITADAIVHTSLINSGDSLKMYDASGQLIDTVNGSAGAWYAGSVTTHATMERIDPSVTADVKSNWASSTGGSGAKSSGGSVILGTPKAANSQMTGGSGGSSQTVAVDFVPDSLTLQSGGLVTVTAKITNAQNLFAYGFELNYDPAVLRYKGAMEKSFLGENGAVATSFQSNLQNGQQGTLLVADARTVQPKTGVSGSGDLFQFQFDVVGNSDTTVQAGTSSFVASTTGDLPAQFHALTLNAQAAQLPSVANLAAVQGPQRYSIQLNWDAMAGADSYRVYRKDAHGRFQVIGETTQTGFVDGDGLQYGGFIVPGVSYVYRVTAAQGATESLPSEAVGHDDRGLKGDNNRTDRVDGRDLQNLANHFAVTDSDSGFDPLADTTYDGRVDGSDLIDLGANFARTYS